MKKNYSPPKKRRLPRPENRRHGPRMRGAPATAKLHGRDEVVTAESLPCSDFMFSNRAESQLSPPAALAAVWEAPAAVILYQLP